MEDAPLDARRQIGPMLDACDAVILSDYGSGLVTPALSDEVRRALARRSRRRPVPVLVDSRYRPLDYRRLTACTVGPVYQKPEVAVPTNFRSQINATEASSFSVMPGWIASRNAPSACTYCWPIAR